MSDDTPDDKFNNELAKYLAIADREAEKQTRMKQEQDQTDHERRVALDELRLFTENAIATLNSVTEGMRTSMRRSHRQATTSISSLKIQLGDSQAETIKVVTFPHPSVHPLHGQLYASIGLAKLPTGGMYAWTIHEFKSVDSGEAGTRNVVQTGGFRVGDAYTKDMVQQTVSSLLAEVTALYPQRAEPDEDD